MLPNSGTPSFLESRLGLVTPRDASGGGKRVRGERKKLAGREGGLWDSVQVTREHATTPEVQCNFCSKKFCGGATRIRQHLVDKCESTSTAFLAVKEKLIQVTDEKEEAKQQKVAQKEVDASSESRVCTRCGRTVGRVSCVHALWSDGIHSHGVVFTSLVAQLLK